MNGPMSQTGDLVAAAASVVENLSANDVEKIEIVLERDGLLNSEGNIMGCGPATHNF